MTRPVLCTPLRVEHAALRPAADALRLMRTGMGQRRAASASLPDGPRAIAGVAGGLAPQVRPGDLVVADEVTGNGRRVPIPAAPLVAAALRRLGLTVHVGRIESRARIVDGADRATLARDGALAVDLESAELAAGSDAPLVIRSIVDTAAEPLWRLGTLRRGAVALRALRAAVPALQQWAAATGPREVLLAGPREVPDGAQLVLVVGSANSANSRRLVEVAEREGAAAYLVDDCLDVDLRWLAGVSRVGLTAGASAPPELVDEIVHCLSGLGPITVDEVKLADEDVTFTLPKEVS